MNKTENIDPRITAAMNNAEIALIITAAMMEAGMRDDQEVRELPEAIRKLKEDQPKLKNLKMLDDIYCVVMRHSANRELADCIVEHLRWKPSDSFYRPVNP